MKKLILCSLIILVITGTAFSEDWKFVAKTNDGDVYSISNVSLSATLAGLEGHGYTCWDHAFVDVKINLTKRNGRYSKKYGPSAKTVIESWHYYLHDDNPSGMIISRKVFNSNGKRINSDDDSLNVSGMYVDTSKGAAGRAVWQAIYKAKRAELKRGCKY